MKTYLKIFAIVMTVFALGMAAQAANLIIGNWQNDSGDGWVNGNSSGAGAGLSITNSLNMPSLYQFETNAVSGYAQSLGLIETGYGNARVEINLTSIPGGYAAFTNGHQLQFTFSCPAGTNGGYMQLVQFQYNSPGSGFQNISGSWAANGFSETGSTNDNSGGQPVFDFYNGSPAGSQVVTWDYSSVKASILSAGVTYLQITLVFQTGGGAPANVLLNNVELVDPNPVAGTVIGSWQNDTGDGWVNGDSSGAGAGLSITNSVNMPSLYQFEPDAVAGYAQSLGLIETGYGTARLELNLTTLGSSVLAAFTNGHQMQFTFSCPAGTNGGYMQLVALQYNSAGSGFQQIQSGWTANGFSETGDTSYNSGGQPVFDFYNGSPASSQVVTWDYSAVKASIMSSGISYLQITFVFQTGGGAPANVLLNNVVLLTSTNPVAPPTLGIQPTVRGLRVFAGSTANTYDRAEQATTDNNQSWVGGNYPVSYSFNLLSYPKDIAQTHIKIIPANTSGGQGMGNAGSANEYIDYQASNLLWLNISNAVSGVVARVEWKTNLPNANPNHTEIAVANSTAVGTWTLTFNSASTGTLTAPGASPVAFTINDPNVSTDFANPAVAYFGLQPNTGAGIGEYEDWGSITVTGVSGAQENENFATESSYNPNGYWANNSGPNSTPYPDLQFVPAGSPYWISWSMPAVGFGLGTAMSVTGNTNTSGYPWVLPEYYNNYGDGLNLPGSAIQGTNTWVQVPTNCLPTSDGTVGGPLSLNAFFQLFNPALQN